MLDIACYLAKKVGDFHFSLILGVFSDVALFVRAKKLEQSNCRDRYHRASNQDFNQCKASPSIRNVKSRFLIGHDILLLGKGCYTYIIIRFVFFERFV